MKITARYTFEAAHRLHDPALSPEENARVFGPCAEVHGHTYRLEVSLRGSRVEHGMLINFADLDALVKSRVIALLDHRFINDLPYFREHPSTAEGLARWVWQQLAPLFERGEVSLEEVTVFEGERFSETVDRQSVRTEGGE